MRWIKRIVTALILITVFYWSLLFRVENTSEVPLSLVFFTLPEASLSVWMVIAFAFGVGLSLLLSSILAAKQKAQLLISKRQLEQCHRQLAKLRAGTPGE
ncbi:MAG: LapA family protein [Pseudomonadales bacterium]|nr:LapA family protein [Pseudomonadales bacterium]MCP5214138.1 LapA family protein [Pseudomonadales bacterium]MCP5302668.1 LapA family protein [Pseudomonadales bacterium]